MSETLWKNVQHSVADIRARLADPRWEYASRVHDWRNYVPELVRVAWPTLTDDARLAVYLTAEKGADAEIWD